MESSASAVVQNIASTPFDWNALLTHPITLTILSSGIILGGAKLLLNLGGSNQKVNDAITDISELKTDVRKLLTHVDIIRTHIVTTGGLSADLFSAASPLKLLPKGIKALEASGFKKIYADNKNWFVEKIKHYEPKTLADIDEASFKVMEKCRDDAKFADFKEIAFENGIPLDSLLRVISIYLRDEVAEEILERTT